MSYTTFDNTSEVKDWLRNQGFEPFVALAAQSLQDIDSGIIGALRAADYFVFIDFKREKVTSGGREMHRGSVYAHQELGIAYALGFEECMFLREKGVGSEGMGAFIMVNPLEFGDRSEVLQKVQMAAAERGWTPSYSRHLVVGQRRWIVAVGRIRGTRHSTAS